MNWLEGEEWKKWQHKNREFLVRNEKLGNDGDGDGEGVSCIKLKMKYKELSQRNENENENARNRWTGPQTRIIEIHHRDYGMHWQGYRKQGNASKKKKKKGQK